MEGPLHPRSVHHGVDDNASRGQLPVKSNQHAAWSAVLLRIIVLTNLVTDGDLANDPFMTPTNWPWWFNRRVLYNPFDLNTFPPVARIVHAINQTRNNTNLFPTRAFARMGDILSVPELTVGSRFLSPTNYVGTYPNGLWTGSSPFITGESRRTSKQSP